MDTVVPFQEDTGCVEVRYCYVYRVEWLTCFETAGLKRSADHQAVSPRVKRPRCDKFERLLGHPLVMRRRSNTSNRQPSYDRLILPLWEPNQLVCS